MAITPTHDVDKKNHPREPPMKNMAVFPAIEEKESGERERGEKRRQCGCCCLRENFSVPLWIFNLQSAAAEKVIRIISLRGVICVPVPSGRGK